jgi:isocitrate lyase
MLAYVRLVQSREKELGVDVLTHQKWSGAPYMDGIIGAIQSGSSSNQSMGEGNTEKGKMASLRSSRLTANIRVRLLSVVDFSVS